MNSQFSRAKKFSEILDHTFQLCKNNFSTFFLILLFTLGPLYLLEAILLVARGTGFFIHTGTGANYLEQILAGMDETFETGADISGIVNLGMLFLLPLSMAAILLAVKRIKDGESFTPGSIIKQAGVRYGPLLGSSVIIGLIFFVVVFVMIIALIFPMFIPLLTLEFESAIGTIILMLLLFLGIGLLVFLWFTRWSFYLAAVLFREGFPGIGYSWRLTKKNTWRIAGLFIIITLITSIITGAVDMILVFILGNSVLYTIISSVVVMITYMISSVAYAVIYFDLKLRHEGDDLRKMIDDYQNN